MFSDRPVTVRVAVAALALLGLGASARAQAPTPAAAAPPPAAAPLSAPPPDSDPAAPADIVPGSPAPAATDAPPEITFGRSAPRAATTPPPSGAPAEAGDPSRGLGRARTMEEVASASTAELSVHNQRWRYSLNFFGDISLAGGHPAGVDHQLGFSLGAQDLLIRGELSSNIVAATEIAFEPSDQGVSIDLERFNVRWQSATFFIEAGRTHTGIGYWNNAYHHGRWLQPTIARPRWVAFEDNGGLLPVHWVGAGTGARLPLGGATLNLMATVGNGRGKIVDDVRNAGDYQAAKAYHLSAELVGIARSDLRIGVAGIFDRIPAQPATIRPLLPDQEISETIGAAHIAYVNVPVLFITEAYLVAHTAGGHQWSTYGGFALLGYTIGRFTPYLQFERIAAKGGADPFFVNTALIPDAQSFDTAGGIVGLRLDLSDWTALKVEYRQTHAYDTASTQYEGILNWSWGF